MALPAPIQTFIDAQADAAPGVYRDLRAVIFNGTLKRSPERSQTDGLLAIARGLMERLGVRVDEVRTVDHEIPHHRPRRPDLAGRSVLDDAQDHRAPLRVLR